jgi:DNA-binding SARP family transcriptional activator
VLHFRILGPLEVRTRDGPLDVVGPRQRSLLGFLLVRRNEIVPADAIVDAVWGDNPPRTAATSLQNGVSLLRKLLGADALTTRPPGYVLHVEDGALDAARFDELTRRAASEEPAARAATLREALALFRGEPLADFAYEAWAQDEIRRLQELRLVAREDLLAAELDAGGEAEVAAEAQALLAQQPLRERLRAVAMRALYRAGRQAEALRLYHEGRRALDEELGLEPGLELQDLHRAILRHDPALERDGHVPASGARDPVPAIAHALATGRLVVVLGASVAGELPSAAKAAARLAEVFGLDAESATDLARAAQHVAVAHGVGPLYDELDALYASAYPPGPVHRELAEIARLLRAHGRPRQLVVAAGFDSGVERALAAVDEPCDVVSYVAVGRDRGRFLHRAPDGTARVVVEPNVELGLTPAERTVVLRIHGGAEAGRDGGYVVSEDDHIDYLAGAEPAALLPVALGAQLRRSHLLFLGYELEDWALRVFLRRLWGDERIGYRSWAVGADDGTIADYWRQRDVDFVEGAPEDVLAAVRALVEAELPRAVPA